jgi:ankyrin repeat protein
MRRGFSTFIVAISMLIGSLPCSGIEPMSREKFKPDFESTKNQTMRVMSGLVGKGELDDKMLKAIEDGNLTLTRACLQQGAQANAKTKTGLTALMLACCYGHTGIAGALLEKGADMNLKTQDYAFNALHFACMNGYPETVKSLLEKGVDVNGTSKDGSTPLIWAAYRGRLEVVKVLLTKDPNINAVDNDGKTAAQWANTQGYPDVAQLLQSPSRSIDIKQQRSLTPK